MEMDEMTEVSNLASKKKVWEDLFANPAWVLLVKEIQLQVDRLQQDVLFGEVVGPETLYQMERKKGQIEGRLSLASLAETLFEVIQTDLRYAQERKERQDVEA